MFKVRNIIRADQEYRYPEIEIKDKLRFICVKLAHKGYFGGDPDRVRKAPVTSVLDILDYEAFLFDFEETYRSLNGTAQ